MTFVNCCKQRRTRVLPLSPGSKACSETGTHGPLTCRVLFFSSAVEKLYKQNALAAGRFEALGQRVDLATIKVPVFLLAARDDELVAPPQLFAAEHLIGTPAQEIKKAVVAGRHVSLFMGKQVLENTWPAIARWIATPSAAMSEQQARPAA